MFSKFSKQTSTIFLDKESGVFDIDGRVDIILSPSLYWVKKVSLPVKYVREAKSLLPSLFEEILPEGIYSYSAYKSEEDFYIFAYEYKLILDTLASKGVTSSQIRNVYFAQSELFSQESGLKIDESRSLYTKDEVLILMPSVWLKENVDLDLSAIVFSKNSVTLKQFSHLVNDRSLYTFIGILTVLLVLIAIEYFITLHKIDAISQARSEVFSKNGLKSTMLQNRSLLKEYKNQHMTQTRVREYTSELLKLSLKDNVKLSLMEIKNKTYKVEFMGTKNGSESEIIKELKSKHIRFKSTIKDESTRLEIEL